MAQSDRLETYATSYFTGSQASIWIDDIWVDEVFGISFSASQSILPIYGYASTFFDAVARGKVLVQGVFEINFVDEGYLYSVLNELSKRRANDTKTADYIADKIRTGKIDEAAIASGDRRRKPEDVIIEQIQLLATLGNGAYPDGKSRRQTMSQIMNEIAQLDTVSITRIASHMPPLADGFAPKQPNKNVIYDMIPFTLKGYFGNPELGGTDQGTVKEIRDCFLIGNEMVIDASEEVVKERYSFLARLHV
jgi:hypothetical protein